MIDTLLEVRIKNPDDFLKVKETLTRIGVPSFKDKKLYHSCHILHKKGKYFIVHFKELFALDGKNSTLSEEDIARRNTIAKLLAEWDLVSIVDESKMGTIAPMNSVKIVPYKEKHDWTLEAKYTIGVRH
jgi:hypothetical protein